MFRMVGISASCGATVLFKILGSDPINYILQPKGSCHEMNSSKKKKTVDLTPIYTHTNIDRRAEKYQPDLLEGDSPTERFIARYVLIQHQF